MSCGGGCAPLATPQSPAMKSHDLRAGGDRIERLHGAQRPSSMQPRADCRQGCIQGCGECRVRVDAWPDVAVQSARAARGHARPSGERVRMLFSHAQSHLWRHDGGSRRRYTFDTLFCTRERVRAWADARAAHLTMSGAVHRMSGSTSEPSAPACAPTPAPRPSKTC